MFIKYPTESGTLATQEWANSSLGSYLALSGGTVTGLLTAAQLQT